MKSAQLIEYSLSRRRVEKLIVCTGYVDQAATACRAAAATRVARLLLEHCKPAPSDIHNPDQTRVHGRDRSGRARAHYAAYTASVARNHGGKRFRPLGGKGGGASLRTPQTWDSERVVDYMGVWCDRLLLGDHQQPSRTAVLALTVPYPLQGDAIERTAQSQHHLAQKDVLVVSAAASLPVGLVRQVVGCSAEVDAVGRATSGIALPSGSSTVSSALARFSHSNGLVEKPALCSTLLIGVGDSGSLRGPFNAEEEQRMRQLLIPLSTFACALWTTNPAQSAKYVAEMTPHPEYLTARVANQRLWHTMQSAMLSTRDTALLAAHVNGDAPLDPRLQPAQQVYLVQTLLERLHERDRHPPP